MQTAGRLLIWASLPWCGFLLYTGWVAEGGSAFQALFAMLMFGWVPWIAGRVLIMIAQRAMRR
ncbi:hypothetical protein [Cognatishimia sp. MH4019]|uniref:hypothetical protein n=1 Tax=Cognatishimia sp. MH4019 TaxID=2854030 RepID=UPI001CD2D905|nr:hypothetical protein [Cognatishimia sp. MH4019]